MATASAITVTGPAMSPSIAAVFNTVELLEAILIRINNNKTLLLSQRVNKTFQVTIADSPRIQQILHFQPCPIPSEIQVIQNPLLKNRNIRFGNGYWFRMYSCACPKCFLDNSTDPPTGKISVEYCHVKGSNDVKIEPELHGSWRNMKLFSEVKGLVVKVKMLPRTTGGGYSDWDCWFVNMTCDQTAGSLVDAIQRVLLSGQVPKLVEKLE